MPTLGARDSLWCVQAVSQFGDSYGEKTDDGAALDALRIYVDYVVEGAPFQVRRGVSSARGHRLRAGGGAVSGARER